MNKIILLILFILTSVTSCVRPGETLISAVNSTFEMRLVDESGKNGKEYRAYAGQEVYFLEDKVQVSGADLASVSLVRDEYGAYSVDLRLKKDSARRFLEITRQNRGRRLAIVVDGRVVSAPVIMVEIPGGAIRVSGNFTQDGARDMERKIRGR